MMELDMMEPMTDPDPFAITEQEPVAFFEEFAEDAAAPLAPSKPVGDLVDLHVVLDVPVGLLRAGTNVVSVETHVNYRSTPNVSFDLQATLTY